MKKEKVGEIERSGVKMAKWGDSSPHLRKSPERVKIKIVCEIGARITPLCDFHPTW